MSGSSLSPTTVEQWLSPHRFSVYTQKTGGDSAAALRLYSWNSAIAAACLCDIGHFEVLIRNRYAVELDKAGNWTQPGCPLWSTEVGMPTTRQKQRKANKKSRQILQSAIQLAPANTPGHVIANLTFGFWAALTRPERDATIWTPMLSNVVPGRSRGHLHDAMNKLNNFRNRLAHWEPVFSTTTGLALRLSEFDQLFREIDPDVAYWVGSQSKVPDVIAESPLTTLAIDTSSYLRPLTPELDEAGGSHSG